MTRAPTPNQLQHGWGHRRERNSVSSTSGLAAHCSTLLPGMVISASSPPAGADVTVVDVSPTMIERLDQRAYSEGLDIEAHVMGGEDLDFDDDSFDVVSSLSHIASLPDAETHLAEMTRVARHGGQVQMVALGATDKAEFRAFLESGGLAQVRITADQGERDGEFTVVNVGIGARR